jgi:hypothetical protein
MPTRPMILDSGRVALTSEGKVGECGVCQSCYGATPVAWAMMLEGVLPCPGQVAPPYGTWLLDQFSRIPGGGGPDTCFWSGVVGPINPDGSRFCARLYVRAWPGYAVLNLRIGLCADPGLGYPSAWCGPAGPVPPYGCDWDVLGPYFKDNGASVPGADEPACDRSRVLTNLWSVGHCGGLSGALAYGGTATVTPVF